MVSRLNAMSAVRTPAPNDIRAAGIKSILTREIASLIVAALNAEEAQFFIESRGVHDTHYRVEYLRSGHQFCAMLNVSEPVGVSLMGRALTEAEQVIEYMDTVSDRLTSGFPDSAGEPVAAVVPRTVAMLDPVTGARVGSIRLEFAGVEKVVSVQELIFDRWGKLRNLAEGDLERAADKVATGVGRALAALHLIGDELGLELANRSGPETWVGRGNRIRWLLEHDPAAIRLVDPDRNRARRTLSWLEASVDSAVSAWPDCYGQLPRGLCHLDLHPVNVVDSPRGLGILDFGALATEVLAFDLAMTLNFWCCADGRLDSKRARALVAGYQRVRRLSGSELGALPGLVQAAALWWGLSRTLRNLESRSCSTTYSPHESFLQGQAWQGFRFS